MSNFFNKLRLAFHDRDLRKRILFVVGALAFFRLMSAIPVPGVDALKLEQFLGNNQFFGLINIFSGGGLSSLSIIMLGVGPFVTASIIMQLLTMVSDNLKKMYQEEGELGKKKFSQYSRILTIPLAIIQSFAFLSILEKQGVVFGLSPFETLMNIVVITAGSMLLMWIGELISEFGIGNGVSLIIFGGIVSSIPSAVAQSFFSFTPDQIPVYLGFIVAAVVIIVGVVIVTEAERPIPITYAKRVRGNRVYGGISTYLPLRVNQAGVIPIIFALSLLLFPQMIFNFLSGVDNSVVQAISKIIFDFINNPWLFSSFYFILVFLFTYFYTAITFDPNSISENLQKSGAFIPGVRPGASTAEYISRVLTRLTLVGALFLGFIAVIPLVMNAITGIQSLAIGGTGLLIVVSVVLDLLKKVDAQISMREY
jgi:preprotein translocase subunit SecY